MGPQTMIETSVDLKIVIQFFHSKSSKKLETTIISYSVNSLEIEHVGWKLSNRCSTFKLKFTKLTGNE